MPNNFRITSAGAKYISEVGSDASGTPTNPDTPLATLQSTVATYIIGTGVYKQAPTNATATTLIVDGNVKVNATGNFSWGGTGVASFSVNNAQSVHYLRAVLNGFTLTTGNNNATNTFYNFIAEGGTITITTGNTRTTLLLIKGVLESITVNTSPKGHLNLDYCKVFNSTINLITAIAGANHSIKNSYIDAATTILAPTYITSPTTNLINNNIQGKFNLAGILYELKREKDGTAIDPNPAVLDWIAIDATIYSRGNYSQDPEFNYIEKRDYWSVANTSPMLFADSTGSGNIGDVYFADTVKATDAEFASPVSSSNIATSVGDLIFSGTPPSGIIVSKPYQIAPIAQVVQYMDFVGLFEYDSLQIIGGAENKNVLQVEAYAPATAGINPGRLVREYRWTESTTEPVLDADYTNSGYIDGGHPAGSYFRFEKGTMPLVSTLLVGNGDPTFSSASAGPIKICWIQERVTIFQGR